MQTRELEHFAQARGWQVAGCYVDTVSGSKDRRPELDRLMADAHKRKFDVVPVWKFDRFARSVSHLLRALETLNALGIAFASLTVVPDARRIAALREQGLSWAKDRRAPGHRRGDSLPSCARTRQNPLFQATRNSLRDSDQLNRIPSARKFFARAEWRRRHSKAQ